MDVPGWLTAAATVAGVLGTGGAGLMHVALGSRDSEIRALKGNLKTCWEKYDSLVRELHDYKLHVAETYVATDKLEKMLDPLNRRLENIENDLRDARARHG